MSTLFNFSFRLPAPVGQRFRFGLVAGLTAGLVLPAPAAPTRWEESAARKKELTKDVVWLSHEPLQFQLRRGGSEHREDDGQTYATMVSPENIRRMAAADVRFSQIYFYKGFGIDYERPNFETAKRAVALMHELGMKTSVYVGGSMFTETFYRETPAARDWERRDQDNRPVPYGTQLFRHYACTNEPAYRDYLKRVLKYAVEEVKPDEIFLDNLMYQSEPQSCRCPRCLAAFRKYLRARYPTPESAQRRFGLPDVEAVQMHPWDSAAQAAAVTAIDDPVLQEWVRFRCEALADYTLDLADYVKRLNPAIAVNLNLKGVYSFNRYWTNAVYQTFYAGHFDFIHFDTGGHDARIDAKTGALVSQIRSYKLARLLGVNALDVIDEGEDLRAAVHLAFSYQKPLPGWPGAPWHEGLNHTFTPLLEFFREYNARYFTGTQNVADVAVLRNWASMAYSVNATYGPVTLVEQTLIQHNVPFDLLFDEQLGQIDRYGTVVLAAQECISRAQADTLLRYVRDGGTLVLTDNTGEFNEWRERWRVNPLRPARPEGKGRIVHLPKVVPGLPRAPSAAVNEDPEPGATLRPGETMGPAQWVLPHNHREIFQAITNHLPQGGSLTSSAPLTTVMELVNRPASRETMLHLINFETQKPTAPIDVSARSQFPGKVRTVTLLSPDANEAVSLPFTEKDGRVNFTVPSVRLYSLAVVGY